jgi:hypothetical protein
MSLVDRRNDVRRHVGRTSDGLRPAGPWVRIDRPLAGLVRVVILTVVVSACGADVEPEIVWVEGSAGSTTLAVAVSTCRADGLTVEVIGEDADVVRLRASATSEGSGDECADGRDVQLAAPLGDRTVVDERSGNEVDVMLLEGP